MTPILWALILGGLFGFALDRVGATNPDNIITMLRLTRLYLARVILFAIGLASTLLFAGLLMGWFDVGHMSVKATYWGVLIGGGLLGLGFAIAGYCPGTGLTALATGRKDAGFFVLGGLAGAFAYMLTFPWWKNAGLLDNLWGGKVTIAAIEGSSYAGLLAMSGELIGLALGIGFMVLAWALPERILKK